MFELATDKVQGEKYATIGCVAPLVAGIHSTLCHFSDTFNNGDDDNQIPECLRPLVTTLLTSMRSRFAGLLKLMNTEYDESSASEVTFGNEVYLTASLLDPGYRDMWCEKFFPLEKGIELKKKVSQQ